MRAIHGIKDIMPGTSKLVPMSRLSWFLLTRWVVLDLATRIGPMPQQAGSAIVAWTPKTRGATRHTSCTPCTLPTSRISQGLQNYDLAMTIPIPLQEALRDSITSGTFVDTKFWVFSKRRSKPGRVGGPKALFVNEHVAKRVPRLGARAPSPSAIWDHKLIR